MTRQFMAPTAALVAVAMCIWPAHSHAQAQTPPAQQAAQSGGAVTPEQRLSQLEEQILDLKVQIGTLQSLARGGGGAAPGDGQMAPPPGSGGDPDTRIDAIETQIRALTGQIEQITIQLNQIAARVGGVQPLPQAAPAPAPSQTQPGASFGTTTVQPDQTLPPAPQAALPPQSGAQMDDTPWLRGAPGAAMPGGETAGASSPAQAKAMYEAAYASFLERNFPDAEKGFRDFLAAYPDDELAGNAQYWLGETLYARRQYREAADTFLAGYRRYKGSNKAADSLLKLGMALVQLGENDAACATLTELGNRFPGAPPHVKQRAASERQRAGC